MCLIVAETPTCLAACAVERVYKALRVRTRHRPVSTPLGVTVPRSGWLLASRKLTIDLEPHYAAGCVHAPRLTAHCVHSYAPACKLRSDWISELPGVFAAFAVGVVAWGAHHDVGSVLLYIPEAATEPAHFVASTVRRLNEIYEMPLTSARWRAVKALVAARLPRRHFEKLTALENYDW